MFYSLGARYKYSVTFLPFSAGLCEFSFLINQDGKNFYFIIYIIIICFSHFWMLLLKGDKSEESIQFIIYYQDLDSPLYNSY